MVEGEGSGGGGAAAAAGGGGGGRLAGSEAGRAAPRPGTTLRGDDDFAPLSLFGSMFDDFESDVRISGISGGGRPAVGGGELPKRSFHFCCRPPTVA